jgi:hypothetical protein
LTVYGSHNRTVVSFGFNLAGGFVNYNITIHRITFAK